MLQRRTTRARASRRALPGFLLAALWVGAQDPPAPPTPPETAPEAGPAREADADEIPVAELERERAYFAVVDYDGNGWISFREASESLEIDRAQYQLYDTDRDGRVVSDEFAARYRDVVRQIGAFKPPIPANAAAPLPVRTPEQIRTSYDRDGDAALDADELGVLLRDYAQPQLDSVLVLDALDRDRSGRLDMAEFSPLVAGLNGTVPMPAEVIEAFQPRSVLELFGRVNERPVHRGGVPLPPLVVGPVDPFHRLDIDRDGFVSEADLRTLQYPVVLRVRASTVLASLDRDRDGRLTREEFRGAFD